MEDSPRGWGVVPGIIDHSREQIMGVLIATAGIPSRCRPFSLHPNCCRHQCAFPFNHIFPDAPRSRSARQEGVQRSLEVDHSARSSAAADTCMLAVVTSPVSAAIWQGNRQLHAVIILDMFLEGCFKCHLDCNFCPSIVSGIKNAWSQCCWLLVSKHCSTSAMFASAIIDTVQLSDLLL